MTYFVYILESEEYDWKYVGLTKNLEHRLIEHNSGRVRFTKFRRPYKLIYQVEVTSLADARSLEKKLKNGFAKKRLLNNIED